MFHLSISLAKVTGIVDEKDTQTDDGVVWSQRVRLEFLNGARKAQQISIDYGGQIQVKGQQKVTKGERVVVASVEGAEGTTDYIADTYRLPAVLKIAALFFVLVILLGRWKGLGSVLGLGVSILILLLYAVPRILNGDNPLTVGAISAFFIAIVTLYLAHGFRSRTSIALIGTLISITFATALAGAFVRFARLFGTGSEDAFYLQAGATAFIDLRGLLLAGIIIGVLGVLDDITTGTAAAVHEIHKTDPRLRFRELYRKGISVGTEHIASLVNTLALAYVGASFPLLLLFASENPQPLWAVVNSELISEEIIRTLVGSMALLAAVPLTTTLAAWWYGRSKNRNDAQHPDAMATRT